jgi:aryl-alcohol dehydrogenase-like predicted oxidoreductase
MPDRVWKLNDPLFDRLEGIEALALDPGAPAAQYSLDWTSSQPAMASLIVGARRIEQIQQAVAATEITTPAARREKTDALCPPPWRQPDPVRG